MYVFQGLSGYLLLLGLMIGEGIGLPIPSEVIMPLVGYYSYEGSISLYMGVISGTVGSLIGSIIAYYIGFFLGFPFLKKYGKYFLINEKRIDALHSWFIRYGDFAVFGFRFVPELRALISYPAGIAKMSMLRFLVFTLLGHLIWDISLSILGYHYANEINYVISLAEKFGVYAIGLTIVLIVVYVIIKFTKK
ncbi:DedA family protein [Sulfurisphaera ohwakuensis]|uniref:DedA family protein n=1 Tax=Sulfurisphaera ohwakuensis TaxID=69656 RepID=UPI0036F28510